jgi:hypothetical protein
MRPAVGVLYWFVVGLLALHALYVSVGESRPWPAGYGYPWRSLG